jgi:hypothetical protein
MHTWPTYSFVRLRGWIDDGKADAAEESMFHTLHVSEEIREMHNARHVGVGELDAFGAGETLGHGRKEVASETHREGL